MHNPLPTMRISLPPQARKLLVLALVALGFALGTNAVLARFLIVDPDRLASAKAGAPTHPGTRPSESPPAGDTGAAPSATDLAGGQAAVGEGDGVATADAPGPSAPDVNPLDRSRLGVDWWKTPILHRNLFDSTNSLAANPDAGTPGEAVIDGDCTRKSEMSATLIAISVASDPMWSTALVSMASGGAALALYRIGDALADATIKDVMRPVPEFDDGGRLTGMKPARLHILRAGACEFLEAGTAMGKPTSAATKTEPLPGKDGLAAATGKHDWAGIRELGPGEYAIDKAERDYALANLDKLGREARLVPNIQDGSTTGFKVFSIRRDSALRKMGVQNNDVVTAVNGQPLNDMNNAMGLLSKLASETNFTFEIQRDGKPMTMRYAIQ